MQDTLCGFCKQGVANAFPQAEPRSEVQRPRRSTPVRLRRPLHRDQGRPPRLVRQWHHEDQPSPGVRPLRADPATEDRHRCDKRNRRSRFALPN